MSQISHQILLSITIMIYWQLQNILNSCHIWAHLPICINVHLYRLHHTKWDHLEIGWNNDELKLSTVWQRYNVMDPLIIIIKGHQKWGFWDENLTSLFRISCCGMSWIIFMWNNNYRFQWRECVCVCVLLMCLLKQLHTCNK